MFPASFCERNSSAAEQSEFSCPTGLDPGSHRQISNSHPNSALAYSKQGQALLEGFNFFKIQNASMMPDRVPLFGLRLADKQQLVSFLKDRGLEIG
jgi:hypothetical protein